MSDQDTKIVPGDAQPSPLPYPTPWQVDRDDDDIVIRDANGYAVVRFDYESREARAIDDATASGIVTACNAHEALRAALVTYGQHLPDCESHECRRFMCSTRDWVRHDPRQHHYYNHEFEPKDCTCGLSAALTLAEGQS